VGNGRGVLVGGSEVLVAVGNGRGVLVGGSEVLVAVGNGRGVLVGVGDGRGEEGISADRQDTIKIKKLITNNLRNMTYSFLISN
jgi:hypothetical protein